MPDRSAINIIASTPFGVLGGISGLIGSLPIGLTLGLFKGIYLGLNANFDYFGLFYGILFSPFAAAIGVLVYTPMSTAGWGVDGFIRGFDAHFKAASFIFNSIEQGVSYLASGLFATIEYLKSCHRSSFTKPSPGSVIKVESDTETQDLINQQSVAYKSNMLFLNGLVDRFKHPIHPENRF
jgi:hypothetical protein